MFTLHSLTDTHALAAFLHSAYALVNPAVQPHRDWIGHVYAVQTETASYILKIYRPFHTQYALNTVGILQYLAAQGYPAVRIVPTAAGEPTATARTPAGDAAAMLYPMITGQEPDADGDLAAIAAQTGVLHRVMAGYSGDILKHGKAHYIGRYLQILKTIAFPRDKFKDLQTYGDALWGRFEKSARGFCHGDLHCGNMRRDAQGRYWLFDFDAACLAHPCADIAVFCDRTDYFRLREDALAKTRRALDGFIPAYEKKRGAALRGADIRALYAFIAIRHYDIQATITDCQGYTMQNLENQHRWLMDWHDLCERTAL